MKRNARRIFTGLFLILALSAGLVSCAAGQDGKSVSVSVIPAEAPESGARSEAVSGNEAAGGNADPAGSGENAPSPSDGGAESTPDASEETGAASSEGTDAESDTDTGEAPAQEFTLPETVADLKAMDLASIPYVTPEMMDLLASRMVRNVPGNDCDLSAFREEDGFIVYEAEGYECLRGIDVSSHQGEIDWDAVRAAGIDFVMIRAGFRGYGESGSLNEDGMFRTNLAAAKEAGLYAGAYFFSQAISEAEAEEEADFVLGILNGEALDLPLVFDVEHIRGDDARTDHVRLSQFTSHALAFCRKVEEAGYAPMVYTNLLWEVLVYDMEAVSAYPVWYAGYDPYPVTPYRFEIWQYSETGTVPGIDGPVDLDLMIRKTAP